MNGFFLIIPLLVIRFIILGMLDPASVKEAAHFAPMEGKERAAYYIYQSTTLILLIFPFFLRIRTDSIFAGIGWFIYVMGILILLFATIDFTKPEDNGLRIQGMYHFSRNPMYMGYFFYFLGCVMVTESILLLLSLICFQLAAHWLILAEERWCIDHFGKEYLAYQKSVRRYF